jgi:hypothetical protein
VSEKESLPFQESRSSENHRGWFLFAMDAEHRGFVVAKGARSVTLCVGSGQAMSSTRGEYFLIAVRSPRYLGWSLGVVSPRICEPLGPSVPF